VGDGEFCHGSGNQRRELQSITWVGRFPDSLAEGNRRFTLGHFLNEMERQSKGEIVAGDFTPIPCPDPRCGAIMYTLVDQGRWYP